MSDSVGKDGVRELLNILFSQAPVEVWNIGGHSSRRNPVGRSIMFTPVVMQQLSSGWSESGSSSGDSDPNVTPPKKN